MISAVKERAKKVEDLAKRYNELIDKLPEAQRPPKLQKEDFKDLGIGDKLWQIDLFRSYEKWAFQPSIRRGIDALNLRSRSLEEVEMVAAEAERFLRSTVDKLSRIGRLLCTTDPNTFCFQRVLHVGLKTSQTLNQMTHLQDIGEGVDCGNFEPVKKSIQKLQGV
jgi:hypothetical protein